MPFEPKKCLFGLVNAMGRSLLRRLEAPVQVYEKRIINKMQSLRNEIQIGDVVLVEGRSERIKIIQLVTKSAWSHAAFYVGDRLKNDTPEHMQNISNQAENADREHMLIEAEAGTGVTAVPLSKYEDYNIIGLCTFDYQPIWAENYQHNNRS